MADIQNQLRPNMASQMGQLGRRLCAILAGLFLVMLVSACGSGSADEPYSPGPRVVSGSVAVSSTASNDAQTPDQIGVSTNAGTTDASAPNINAFTPSQCNIDYLNATRFLSSGIVATGIDDSIQCGLCPSAEVCTTPDGVCHCIVVNVVN